LTVTCWCEIAKGRSISIDLGKTIRPALARLFKSDGEYGDATFCCDEAAESAIEARCAWAGVKRSGSLVE
jgi:hypothetical protein